MFTDRVRLQLQAGKGGNGVIAWRREKYIPKGGPCGGNGGPGGSVVLTADAQVPSLDHYRNQRILRAENGGQGGSNDRNGRRGRNLVLKVPLGTLLKDSETGEVIFDFVEHGQTYLICEGGRGGIGNNFFKTPTNRAPNKCTPGKYGEVKSVELELKLIADVGFVGFPNAGKSTLLTQLARVRVKVAPYPFTTLHPNLGCLRTEKNERVIFADIPGIISGAHLNRGLGLAFLRHIERTKVLVFVVDGSGMEGRDPLEDLAVLRKEIEAYQPSLLQKPSIVVWNKADLGQELPEVEGYSVSISALTGDGVERFLTQVLNLLEETTQETDAQAV
ncbi:MAG: GTPase ObgE [Verrucomicrobia bacterium]|nr:GTPase ObgE [Verrucomicrobiota bacterium]MBS0646582.1 GTPase ObgE [Verrucomicrobiota bacterium]